MPDTKADAVRVARNKSKASRSGKKGEAIVREYHAVAHAGGVAHLFHVPTDTIRVPKGKTWTIIYRSKSTVDSVGYLMDGSGRHVAEEIKTCTAAKAFYLKEVEPHQRAYLDAVLGAGGVAVLTVVFGENRDVCVVPWVYARSKTKLTAEDLEPCKVTQYQYLRQFVRDDRLEVRSAITGEVIGFGVSR